MKKPGCNKCEETQIQGRCYIDPESGMICVTLEKKIELADAEVSEEKTAAAEADSIAAENDFSEEKTEDTSNE